jgi:hypothetical protein
MLIFIYTYCEDRCREVDYWYSILIFSNLYSAVTGPSPSRIMCIMCVCLYKSVCIVRVRRREFRRTCYRRTRGPKFVSKGPSWLARFLGESFV